MFKILKNIIRGLLKKFNLQINYANNAHPRYIKAIDTLGINLIFDIGANIGLYSIYAAYKFQKIEITAFEPSTSNLRILSRNI